MSYDLLIRAVAGVAALALIGAPAIAALAGKIREWQAASQPNKEATGSTSIGDMRTVLDLASRLRANGNTAGVHLCQQLLDVMLAPSGATK